MLSFFPIQRFNDSTIQRCLLLFFALALSSCATTSNHQFAQPAADWQTRTGQLMFRNAKTTMIGEVVVRFAKSGGFELTFAKGPVTMLGLRQDSSFAEARGAMAGPGWAGPAERAPQQLKGWLELRDVLLRSPNQSPVRHVHGTETFVFHF